MNTASTLALTLAGAVLSLSSLAATLPERWDALRAAQPNLMIRDAARTLGVSEAELLATGVGAGGNVGKQVILLRDDTHAAREIMRRALDLGPVLALTRNENGVIERTGVASKVPPPTMASARRSE